MPQQIYGISCRKTVAELLADSDLTRSTMQTYTPLVRSLKTRMIPRFGKPDAKVRKRVKDMINAWTPGDKTTPIESLFNAFTKFRVVIG